jgi:sugar phosphate permease
VQTVVSLRDVPVATALTLFYQQLGASLFLAIAQTILLNKLIPGVQKIDPNLSEADIIRAGATGLTTLLQGEQLAEAIIAYASGLDAAFLLAVGAAAVSVILACPVEWRSIKSQKHDTKEDEFEKH